jgi:hypothetical protein
MRSVLIQIDPKLIKRDDLPVDPANIKEIERQAKAWGGIHTPIEVWINDEDTRRLVFDMQAADLSVEFLIMDGFHRTNVAVAMGMPSVSALLYDCTEIEFWDKRIAQAKKHHVVEDDRLHAWMVESWKREFGNQKSEGFTEAIYTVYQAMTGAKKVKAPTDDVKTIQSWIEYKATMWGRKTSDVARVVLEKEKVVSPRFPEALSIAGDVGLDVKQTARLTKAFPKGAQAFGRGLNQTEMKQYTSDVVAKGEDTPPAVWKEQKRQQAETAKQRQSAYYETPAGVEEKRRRRIENGVAAINGLRVVEHRIADLLAVDLDELLLARPDVLEKIKRFFGKVDELSEKLRFGQSFQLPPADAIEMRAAIQRLQGESRMNQRDSFAPVNPHVLAISSHEIEIAS